MISLLGRTVVLFAQLRVLFLLGCFGSPLVLSRFGVLRSSHQATSRHVTSRHVTSPPLTSPHVPFRSALSHPVRLVPSRPFPSLPITSRRVMSRRVASRRVASRRVASRLSDLAHFPATSLQSGAKSLHTTGWSWAPDAATPQEEAWQHHSRSAPAEEPAFGDVLFFVCGGTAAA